MDWEVALRRNTGALLSLVALLVAEWGSHAAATRDHATLPRRIYHSVLRWLGPAEAALRRLILVRAFGLVVPAPESRPFPGGISRKGGGGERVPNFQLFDALKWFGVRRKKAVMPRISFLDDPRPAVKPEVERSDDDLIDAGRLLRRVTALQKAMADIPCQAKRLARWFARRQVRKENGLPVRRTGPLRPGWPPGHRSKPSHPMDEILAECHSLAWLSLDRRGAG